MLLNAVCGMAGMLTAWQRRRSEFNHDWLKNRFLPALAKAVNVLDSVVEDELFEKEFPHFLSLQWCLHRGEAFTLAHNFRNEMSPAALLNQEHFFSTSGEWLPELVDALWLSRNPVQMWIDETVNCAMAADAAYLKLEERFAENCNATLQVLKGHEPLLLQFQTSCQELAKAIERFPSRILVT